MAPIFFPEAISVVIGLPLITLVDVLFANQFWSKSISICQEFSYTSTKTISAPEYEIAFNVATNVRLGAITISLEETSARIKETCKPAVPFIHAIACFTPV